MKFVDEAEYIEQLKTLVNIESGSRYPEGLNRVADELEKWYLDIGWHVKRHDLGPETGNMLEISNRPADHYDVMFVGHMDTVFPNGTVAKRPFSMKDGIAYGPGVSDMKNGDVAMYQVATHLSPEALDKLTICMAYNPDEEIGSVYSREALDEIGRRSDYVYVMESSSINFRHCFARKGMLRYELAFHGQAAHSGFMFELDHASAVLEMGHYIVKLMGLASREADTTVNVGVASGGIATNVVAEYASLSVESRFKSPEERARIMREVEAMVNGEPFTPGVRTEIVSCHGAEPWPHTPEGDAHVAHLESLAKELGIPFNQKDRGGLSDGNHLAACGTICSDGMGPHGALDHSDKEHTIIESIHGCVALLCSALESLSKTK